MKPLKIAALSLAVLLGGLLAVPSAQVSLARGYYTLANAAQLIVGTGTATATLGGVLTTSTASVCTAADLLETDLWSYSMPANTLNADGRGVRISVFASTAANTNSKTLRLYFGATVVASDSTASSGVAFAEDALVLRTGATTQISGGHAFTGGNAGSPLFVTPGETLSGAITIKVTGQNGFAAANDICVKGAIVETIK